MESNSGAEPTIGNWNEFSEEIQQIASRLIQSVNSSNRIENYKRIVIDIVANKNILELIFFESSINLYQALLIDALIHWYDGIINALSENNAEHNALLNSFKKLVTQMNNHEQFFTNLQKGIPRYNDFITFKKYVELNYYLYLHLAHINQAKDSSKLQVILDSIENKRNILEFQPEESAGSLTSYKNLILTVLERAVLLGRRNTEGNESEESRAISIEWLSSKFEKYADLFEEVSSDQLPFDYNKAKYFFKVRNELILLTRQLGLAYNLEEIDVVINLFEEIRTKYYFDVVELNNELLYHHNLLLNSILNKAIEIYDENSENYTIEESLDLLNKLLNNFPLTKLSAPQEEINEEWDGAISGYRYLRNLVANNYYFLQLTKILSSENPDLNSVKSLSEETEDTLEIVIDENRLYNIINLYKIGVVENINDLEKILSHIDACKSILDKYVIDTGLSIYSILLVHAISRFINLGVEDISSNNSFSKQLAKYTGFFKLLDTELFPADTQLFFKELKNYGAIVAINESILEKLTEQLKSSERIVNEEETTYSGQVDLIILSDQITIFGELIASYDSFSPHIKEITHNSLKRIIIISAGSFEQVLASKHNDALNAVIKVLFFINNHLQGNPIEDFDNHFAMKVCGHLTHRLYYLKEGDNENTISTEIWLILAKNVLSSIEKNGIENYRTFINYKGDLYRNLKAIYTIQPPREQYISDDSNSITYQLYQKVNEIITLKSEFAVGASASLEERQKNIPLRALACMVKGEPSHLTNVETILVQLTGEVQLNQMKMVLDALMVSSAWYRIISIVENERLIHLKDTNEVIFSYICAKISIGNDLTVDEVKYYKETISDLERIFLAEVFISIGDYNNALFQIDKIKLDRLDQHSINYTLWLMDRFCHTFLYNKNSHDSKLFYEDTIVVIENIYHKFEQIELPLFDSKAQMQYRLLKLYLYCNNEAKINELISKLSDPGEAFREYKDTVTNCGQLNESQKSNLVILLGTCQHELTLEEAMHSKAVFQELADASIENDQIIRDKHNEIIIASEGSVAIEERLLAAALTTPATQIVINSKVIKDLTKTKIKEITDSIDSMTNFRDDEGYTIGYRREFTFLRGSQGWSQCEVQKNGVKGKTTVAQVNYETLKLIDDEVHRKIMKTALKVSLETRHTIQIASGTWEWLVGIANDEERLYQHFTSLIPATNAGDISVLSLRETEIKYWLNYNELALKNLLGLRLKSEIYDEKKLSTIYALDPIKFDSFNRFVSAKLISLSKEIFKIYSSFYEIKTILIPVLISRSLTVNHWIGIVLEKEVDKISISYLDSENQPALEIIKKQFVEQLSQTFSGIGVLFKQPKLETQIYNNCGLELIENFVYFLSGERVGQEIAPYAHSELYVQNIILEHYEQSFRKIEVTKDCLAESGVVKDVIESEFHSFFDNNYLSTLTITYQSESSYEYEAWFTLLKYLGNIDLRWKFKKWLYLKDVATFDQIMQKYNIARSVDELKETKLPFCSFSIEIENKELERDVLFVTHLKEKLNLPITGTREIEYLQPIIYKINTRVKVFDAAVDTIRLIYVPTIDNAKKIVVDTTYFYSMYSGINGFAIIINGIDVVHKLYQKDYNQAFTQALTIAGYMLVPAAISFVAIPHIGFVYGATLTIYSGYSAINNAYSFYQEYNSVEWHLKSVIANKGMSEFLASSPLQQIYDFAVSSKNYEIKVNAISLEIEKAQINQQLEAQGEFGAKLYNYIYMPMLEEKYTLLNKVTNKELAKEQTEVLEAKHVAITIEERSYEHCMEVIKLKDEEIGEEHYYCYNEEQQILDHVLIGENGKYIEILERL